MILFNGKLYKSTAQNKLLDRLPYYINNTIAAKPLRSETVIRTVDRLAREFTDGVYDKLLCGMPAEEIRRYKRLCAAMFTAKGLERRIKAELGERKAYRTKSIGGLPAIKSVTVPLGVVFHIAAGNMDALPAFSVIEGLLAGNINILKLPQADKGLSVIILHRLIEIEPELRRYIYVFDTSSVDTAAIVRMAQLADGISVWGGDAAISAVRKFAPTGAKIIEWGQKLGFCYISGYEDEEAELAALAQHIAATKQLLCSSCQVIYIDTESESELHSFCRTFLPYLEKAVMKSSGSSIGDRARRNVVKRTKLLEKIIGSERKNEYSGCDCSLIIKNDMTLELSPLMCNVLVKAMPRQSIVSTLRQSKYYLQTVGLICSASKRTALEHIFTRCGVNRVTRAGDMSLSFAGEAHDGEYPLRRYTRTVNIEI